MATNIYWKISLSVAQTGGGDANPKGGGINILFGLFFENWINMNEFGSRGRRCS